MRSGLIGFYVSVASIVLAAACARATTSEEIRRKANLCNQSAEITCLAATDLRESCAAAGLAGELSGIALRNVARVNVCAKDFDAAVDAYQRAMPLLGDDEELQLELAEACFQAKKYECARSAAETVTRKNRESCRGLRVLARSTEKLEQFAIAEGNYLRAVRCDPSAKPFVMELGEIYFAKGLWERAARVFQLCVDGNSPDTYCASRMRTAMQELRAQEPIIKFPSGK